MSRAQFQQDAVVLMKDMVRRLETLERSGGSSTIISGGDAPVGTIVAYWGASAPPGWLLCNGGSFSAGTYPDLAARLGGTTLPNLKGKVIVGVDAAQTEFVTLGETGGAKTVALTEGQLAAHDHDDTGHTHFHFHDIVALTANTSGQSNNHGHTFTAGLGGGNIGLTPGGNNYNLLEQGKTTAGVDADHTHSMNHDHGMLEDATVGTADIGNAGSDQAHQNLQPYMAISYIIKAG